MKVINLNKSHQFIFWFFLILSVLITNKYFSLEEVFLNGASDGRDYFSISIYAPEFSNDLAGHKSWRFFYPFLIGLINKNFEFDIFQIYQVTSILIIIHFIYLLNKDFFINKNFIANLIFVAGVIFNPYFFRYFVSLPLLINDLIFIYGTIYLILFLKKEKTIYLMIGLTVICFARQESAFFIITMIICKIIFKKYSVFSFTHINLGILITITIFSINTFYSINSSFSGFSGGYSDGGRFALFSFNFTLLEFGKFISYLIFPFTLIIIIIIFNIKKFTQNIILKFKNEKIIFLFILIIFILAPAIIAGPEISGKNILRLSNLPILFISYLTSLLIQKPKLSWIFNFIFLVLIFIFLQHPKYSLSKLFEILAN